MEGRNMNKEDNKQKIKDTALAGASLGALGASKNMILGKKKMYHGTSKENWEKIRTQGLRADRGGIGGASQSLGNSAYVNASKGNVHLSRFKPVANMYSNDIGNMGPMSMLRQGKDGKRLTINMDYDKFKKMRIDNVGSDDISDIPKALRGVAKNMAAKGNINVLPEEIAGSSATLKDRAKHTLKAMPSYIKNNPARFGGGLALAGAGAYGIKKLNDKYIKKQVKKKEIEKKAMEG